MNTENPDNQPLTLWQSQFFYWLAGSAVLIVFAHWFGCRLPGNTARFLLVIIFFFAVFSFIWAFSQPLAAYLNAAHFVKYRHAPAGERWARKRAMIFSIPPLLFCVPPLLFC